MGVSSLMALEFLSDLSGFVSSSGLVAANQCLVLERDLADELLHDDVSTHLLAVGGQEIIITSRERGVVANPLRLHLPIILLLTQILSFSGNNMS